MYEIKQSPKNGKLYMILPTTKQMLAKDGTPYHIGQDTQNWHLVGYAHCLYDWQRGMWNTVSVPMRGG